jgi:hypothetical protein
MLKGASTAAYIRAHRWMGILMGLGFDEGQMEHMHTIH